MRFLGVAVVGALVWMGCADTSEEGQSLDVTGGVVADAGAALDAAGGGADAVAAVEDAGAPDTGPGVDASEEPWVMQCQPCTQNSDCASGWCVETGDGGCCTVTCIDSCPKDWFCGEVKNSGTDVTFICLARFSTLCQPCDADADCSEATGAKDARCLSYGLDGSFCGAQCGDGVACPEGYDCEEGQCRKSDGMCSCSWKGIKDGFGTSCQAVNEFGTCGGSRSCLSGELSACSAAQPAEEQCNGIDDDCDGAVDEGTGGAACVRENDFGSCNGTEACLDGELVCDATIPMQEACNGTDDDCDGDTDEGFADSNQDGTADCVSLDDDGDGVLDGEDNCPVTANADQSDMDADGLGDSCDPDLDGDGDPNGNDCAPYDSAVGAKATEQCNGTDDDCDGTIDETFGDLDGDGVADCIDDDDDGDGVLDTEDNCPVTANADQNDVDGDGTGDACDADKDQDGDPDQSDCAPTDPTVHHGADELCNGADENCNGIVDEGFPDTDGDGVADCLDTDDDGDTILDEVDNCPLTKNQPQLNTDGDGAGDACDSDDDDDGTVDGLDCAPIDPAIHPGAAEVCNGKDDDCDQVTDEEGAAGCSDLFFDDDGDGFGLDGVKKCLCEAAVPYSASSGGDCDDKNAQVFPGATESCNLKDDNCNAAVDEGAAFGCKDSWVDGDGDGYGAGEAVCVCPGISGYASQAGDCDDTTAAAAPGKLEACNGFDDNCNGLVDEEGALGCKTYFWDGDEDGFGKSTSQQCLCAPAGAFTALADGDCDDLDAERFPGNAEVCDSKDNNCNGQVDEGVTSTFFVDEDGDLWGASYNQTQACEQPAGFVAKAGDCNDFNPAIYPTAAEACNDIDDDCDGTKDEVDPQNPDGPMKKMPIYVDLDGDGFGTSGGVPDYKCLYDTDQDGVGDQPPLGFALSHDDCHDSNSTVYPGAPEKCDGILNNCLGKVADQQCPNICAGSWPVNVGGSSGYAVVGQLDSDNELEVVSWNEGMVRVMNHDGSLLWKTPAAVSYSYPTLADFNGDGTVDLVVPTHGGVIRILKGQDGTELAALNVGTSSGHYGAAVFDVDHNGTPDVVDAGTAPKHLVLLNPDLSVKEMVSLAPLSGEIFALNTPCLYDVDGDGTPEIMNGSGNWGCKSSPESCKGRNYVFRSDGSYFNDPTWTDPTKPWFAVDFYPTSYAGEGIWPMAADLDGDGQAELMQQFRNAAGAGKSYVWSKDGTEHPLSGKEGGAWPRLAPVNADGSLDTSGALHTVTGPVVDIDGDGIYERFGSQYGGIAVFEGGEVMDGWPLDLGGRPVVSDINRDGRMDVVFISGGNNSLNCYTLGSGSWDLRRVLNYGTTEGLGRDHYSTSNYDPFEPNDFPGVPFVPGEVSDPVAESRAFSPSALRDTYSSGGGWSRRWQAALSEQGDRDFYVMHGGIINVSLSAVGPIDVDVYVHIYNGNTYVETWESTAVGSNENINCHGTQGCPAGYHTFIIEVRGKDPDVDFGPWPYTIRTLWAN